MMARLRTIAFVSVVVIVASIVHAEPGTTGVPSERETVAFQRAVVDRAGATAVDSVGGSGWGSASPATGRRESAARRHVRHRPRDRTRRRRARTKGHQNSDPGEEDSREPGYDHALARDALDAFRWSTAQHVKLRFHLLELAAHTFELVFERRSASCPIDLCCRPGSGMLAA